MDVSDGERVLGEIRDGGERHRLIYNLTNTPRLAKPGVPALTRCHFNSSRRLHQNTDKRQKSSLCKGSRKLFTTARREINEIRELQCNHTCFITAHGRIEFKSFVAICHYKFFHLFYLEAIYMVVYKKKKYNLCYFFFIKLLY